MRNAYRLISQRFAIACCVLFCLFASLSAQTKLMAIGGGARPAIALSRFVAWSGGGKARLLIITWASGVPQESFAAAAKEFKEPSPASVVHAPVLPLTEATRREFLRQLKDATGIYFTGGDQNRVMDALDKDAELLRALQERYRAGIPFGGTSAGTAIMTSPMITGDGDLTLLDGSQVKTRNGLDLLPGVILDQHFLKRQRQNRLFGLILNDHKTLGLGIDEATALFVTDNREALVIGNSQVMAVEWQEKSGGLLIRLLRHGDRLDLRSRRLTRGRKLYPANK
jgi:cyanophycinase